MSLSNQNSNVSPVISIVMPLYNKADSLLITIKSVITQTVKEWELIIVDDGSNDNGVKLIDSLGDSRIRLFKQTNSGVSVARNKGIKFACSDLVVFLDADDLWCTDFLATILYLKSNFPEASWYATRYKISYPRSETYISRLHGVKDNFECGLLMDYFKVATHSDPPVFTSACAVRRDAILAVGGFPVGVSSGEDLITWARLAVAFKLAYCSTPKATHMVSGIQRPPDKEQKVYKMLSELFYDHPNIVGFRSYLGLWSRMQGMMSIHFNEVSIARKMAIRSLIWDPRNFRNLYFFFLTCLPLGFAKSLDSRIRKFIRGT